MGASDLLERLRILETELHRLETRRNTPRLEQLLHPDFVELARSGMRYSRAEVLAEFCCTNATLEPVRSEQFELVNIGAGAALLTYISAHENSAGELYRRTLRSSLWVETGVGWQLRFHQGTPADVVHSA
jgi:hypothetical protein